MATRFGKPNRFKSRTDGMNTRSHRWVCLQCGRQHEKKPAGEHCEECDSPMLQYFPSKSEALRYAELRLFQNNGLISELKLQPTYPIIINGIKVCEYRGDFLYQKDGKEILEDVKGTHNEKALDPVFLLKKKLVMAAYGKTISIHVRK